MGAAVEAAVLLFQHRRHRRRQLFAELGLKAALDVFERSLAEDPQAARREQLGQRGIVDQIDEIVVRGLRPVEHGHEADLGLGLVVVKLEVGAVHIDVRVNFFADCV